MEIQITGKWIPSTVEVETKKKHGGNLAEIRWRSGRGGRQKPSPFFFIGFEKKKKEEKGTKCSLRTFSNGHFFIFFFAVNFWIPVEIRPERRMDGPLGWLPNDRSRKNKTKAQRKRFFNNKKKGTSLSKSISFLKWQSHLKNKTKQKQIVWSWRFFSLIFFFGNKLSFRMKPETR